MRRITPARAGKRCTGPGRSGSWRDHPRACGEEQLPANQTPGSRGSPPRVRGRVPGQISQLVDGGITPARAGKSRPGKAFSAPRMDHPRACGEEIISPPVG